MAEQAQKQEAKAQEKPRPAVRLVKLAGEVFFPGAQTLGGSAGKLEIDLEGRNAVGYDATATLEPLGVLVRYTGTFGTKTEPRVAMVPWHMTTRVDLAPEWKP